VKTAQRKKLSAGGMANIRTAKVSDLSDWLDEIPAQEVVNKRK
jgi:hypothetical protein